MNKNIIIIFVVVIIIITSFLFWTKNPNTVNAPADTSVATSTSSVKDFTVTGDNFTFSLAEIKVKKGDTVRINFVNAEGFHDIVIDEFAGADSGRLQAGQSKTFSFVADKTGQFEYYCSVGTHRAMGMKGTLIVE